MVGNVASSHGNFGNLISYQTDLDKCSDYKTNNLFARDPGGIAKEMRATVDEINEHRPDHEKIKNPTYHVSFSWSQGDNPTRDEMMAFGEDFIEHMELEEYQSVIAIHGDTDHPHIHIVANQAHPDGGPTYQKYDYQQTPEGRKLIATDYQKIEEFERMMERELGWELTPGKNAGEWEKEFDGRAPTTGELRQAERIIETGRQQGIDVPEEKAASPHQKATAIKDELYKASSFKEFDDRLSEQGLWLEPKGQGAVITDGTIKVKASSVSRGFSKGKLEGRFNQSMDEYINGRDQKVSAKQGFKEIYQWANLQELESAQNRKQEADTKYKSSNAELKQLQNYADDIQGINQNISNSFNTVFKDGSKAYKEFSKYGTRHSLQEAEAELQANPGRFGTVQDSSEVPQLGNHITELKDIQSQYGNYITDKSKSERHSREQELKSSIKKFSGIKSKASQIAGKAMGRTEEGRAIHKGAVQVKSVAQALKTVNSDPKKGIGQLAKQAGFEGLSKMKGEAGQAVSSGITSGFKYAKQLSKLASNPASGTAKLAKNVVQSIFKQARGIEKTM